MSSNCLSWDTSHRIRATVLSQRFDRLASPRLWLLLAPQKLQRGLFEPTPTTWPWWHMPNKWLQLCQLDKNMYHRQWNPINVWCLPYWSSTSFRAENLFHLSFTSLLCKSNNCHATTSPALQWTNCSCYCFEHPVDWNLYHSNTRMCGIWYHNWNRTTLCITCLLKFWCYSLLLLPHRWNTVSSQPPW